MSKSQTRLQKNGPLGKVLLADKWDQDSWSKLDTDTKQLVYMAHASFSYCMLKVLLPFESQCQGKTCPTTLPAYQKSICDNIQYDLPNVEQMALICFTAAFKTTIGVLFHGLWSIGNDPNLSFLLATNCADNAERYLLGIQRHIEGNETYKFVFGDLYPGSISYRPSNVKWTSKVMTVRRTENKEQPSFRAAGYGSYVTGHRYDRAVCDDVVTRENARTQHERDGVYDFMMTDVRSRLEPDARSMLVIGTIYHYNDAHCRIIQSSEDTKDWIVVKYPILLPGSEWPPPNPGGAEAAYTKELTDHLDYSKVFSAWPDWWGPKKIYADWLNDKTAFYLSRLLIPINPETQKFPIDKLQDRCRADGHKTEEGVDVPSLSCWNAIEGIPARGSKTWNQYKLAGIDIDRMQLVISVDPAVGQVGGKKRSDRSYCVMQLWGMDEQGRRILLDMWRKESAPPAVFVREATRWVDAYWRPGKTRFVYESNAMQKYIAIDLKDRLQVPIQRREMKGNKEDDVESMADLMDSDMLLYCWADTKSRNKMRPFEEELSQWDRPATNDTIMAAVHAMAYFRPASHMKPRTVMLDGDDEDDTEIIAMIKGDQIYEFGEVIEEDYVNLPEFNLPKWKKRLKANG